MIILFLKVSWCTEKVRSELRFCVDGGVGKIITKSVSP